MAAGAEAVAVISIIANVLQLADFCKRVTDRAAEFAGRTAELPGSFTDLKVVLAVVRLNLRRLHRRVQTSVPEDDIIDVLKDLVTLIERDIRTVQSHLEKLPPPGSSWAKVTLRAVISVFSEDKIKKSVDHILQNVELLSQTVTSSLPTADEIANAVNERSNANGIDRKLSIILERMKSKAVIRAKRNSELFESHAQENRASNGQNMQIQGATQVNNTFITLNVPYAEFGKQLDQKNDMLMLPGQRLPFLPLKHALSNPNLPALFEEQKPQEQTAIVGSAHNVTLSQPPANTSSVPQSRTSRSNTTKTYRHSSARSEIISSNSTDIYSLDGTTLVGSTAPSHIGASWDSHPPSAPPRTSRHLSEPQIYPPVRPPIPPPLTSPTVSPSHLHTTIFELPSRTSTFTPASYLEETNSSVGTASSILTDPYPGSSNPSTSTSTSTGTIEDISAITLANAYLREGASLVTSSPSSAKQAYLLAQQTARSIIPYSASFAVRKYRALTFAATGLALSTQERSRYLERARSCNAQALAAACASFPLRDRVSLELRVRLDEADLQMKEARMLEKAGGGAAGENATMKVFTAFGAYQHVAARLGETVAGRITGRGERGGEGEGEGEGGGLARRTDVADFNTHALALLGSGRAAALLLRSGGSFTSSHGAILAPKAYYELARAACEMGAEVAAREARAAAGDGDGDGAKRPVEELAMLRETEKGVLRLLEGLQ